VNRHSKSPLASARAVFAAILLAFTGVPQASIAAPGSRAVSRPSNQSRESQSQSERSAPQPLDPAFKGKLPISELTEDEAIRTR